MTDVVGDMSEIEGAGMIEDRQQFVRRPLTGKAAPHHKAGGITEGDADLLDRRPFAADLLLMLLLVPAVAESGGPVTGSCDDLPRIFI